jgi:hypothetical protein
LLRLRILSWITLRLKRPLRNMEDAGKLTAVDRVL